MNDFLNKSKWNWSNECQKAFDTIKKLVCNDRLLSYPNFNELFEIHVDANILQLVSVISQKGKPIALYSRKFNPTQVNYATIERELFSIVVTIKELRNILLWQQIGP